MRKSITCFLNPMNHHIGEYRSYTYGKAIQVHEGQTFLSVL